MPRDSWVGVYECQQSVEGVLTTFCHPSLPHLTQPVMLRNITFRSWLRYLSPKIANFVLLKLDFWTRQ